MQIKTIGSICSGIDAASVAWSRFNKDFAWFSEIAEFPSRVLKEKHPHIPNLGDMNDIPTKISNGEASTPDLICGGTPCQAFSLAGIKSGLNDNRGSLTLKIADIINANDNIRMKNNLPRTVLFWENVEGILTDKTNAFGRLMASLLELDEPMDITNWASSGVLYGKFRNIAWRVLDAKYFGVPQQRRRLYLLAGGKDFHPEDVLFERHERELMPFPNRPLFFVKDGHTFEIFREYTDCLYAAYGTKWNGNAAATNGSLFLVQDGKIRRLSPLEAERLMGFPDDYTNILGAKRTSRYQVIGNSWAVPVIRWIGSRLFENRGTCIQEMIEQLIQCGMDGGRTSDYIYVPLGKNIVTLCNGEAINPTIEPETPTFGDMYDIVSPDVPEEIYISPVGCYGIVRRKEERQISINPRLEEVLLSCSLQMPMHEIEMRSRIQKRGQFSSK